MSAPLTTVAKVAEGLSEDLSLRASERRGPPEVRSVARALNRTAERLAGFIKRQQQVAADASHHLKTPLTSIRLRLEAIEDTTSNDEVRRDAEAALHEVDRLTRRIDHVLTLARTEAGQDSIVVDPIAVVREREESFLGPVQDRGLALIVEEGAGVTSMLAPPGSLERVLDELVGNALQYAKTRISISVGLVGSAVSVAVADDGPGLDPAEWATVFERFQRGSKAVPGGSGLGLALVRELARAAGGDAVAGRAASGGLVITTTWPAADAWPGEPRS
jgi:signal transduction histidine kinase